MAGDVLIISENTHPTILQSADHSVTGSGKTVGMSADWQSMFGVPLGPGVSPCLTLVAGPDLETLCRRREDSPPRTNNWAKVVRINISIDQREIQIIFMTVINPSVAFLEMKSSPASWKMFILV